MDRKDDKVLGLMTNMTARDHCKKEEIGGEAPREVCINQWFN